MGQLQNQKCRSMTGEHEIPDFGNIPPSLKRVTGLDSSAFDNFTAGSLTRLFSVSSVPEIDELGPIGSGEGERSVTSPALKRKKGRGSKIHRSRTSLSCLCHLEPL